MRFIIRHKILLLILSLAVLWAFITAVISGFDLAYSPIEKVTSRNSYLILGFIHTATLLLFFQLRQRSKRHAHNQIIWLFLSVVFVALILVITLRLDYSNTTLLVGSPVSLLLLLRHQKTFAKQDKSVLFIAENPALEAQLRALGLSVIALSDEAIATDTRSGLLLLSQSDKQETRYGFAHNFDKTINKQVVIAEQFIEDYQGRVAELSIAEIADHAKIRLYYEPFKRVLEVIIAVLLLSVMSPILVVTFFVIKIVSPGTVIFTQERVGLDSKTFTIFKFRTMHLNAEAAGQQFATKGDPRIIKFGHFLRKSRIDELPQLWNVLRGDMSLIGPRPEQKQLFDELCQDIPQFALRQLTRPGITGWAQVVQGYADDKDSSRIKLSHDLYYIKHSGPTLDLLIITRTLTTILTGFGSR